MKSHNIVIRVTDEQKKAIQRISDDHHLTVSELMQPAITRIIINEKIISNPIISKRLMEFTESLNDIEAPIRSKIKRDWDELVCLILL